MGRAVRGNSTAHRRARNLLRKEKNRPLAGRSFRGVPTKRPEVAQAFDRLYSAGSYSRIDYYAGWLGELAHLYSKIGDFQQAKLTAAKARAVILAHRGPYDKRVDALYEFELRVTFLDHFPDARSVA